MKVAWETRKIFEDESLLISCTLPSRALLRRYLQ